MKIIVCFKVITEADRVLQQDFENFSPNMDFCYAGMDFGCFDSPALELALQLKQQTQEQGEMAECTAITAGKSLPESFVQRLLSIGFDRVCLSPLENVEFCPEAVAETLAEQIRDGDVILCGREVSMAETGMVPWLLGEKLHIPVHADVENLQIREEKLNIQCRGKQGLFEREVSSPCLLTVGNSPAVLRAATLRQQLKFRGRQAEVLENPNISSKSRDFSFSKIENGRTCTMLDSESPETWQKILSLLQTASPKNQKKNTGESLVSAQKLQQAVEEQRLYLFPDTEGGRSLAVKTAGEKDLPCFFGGEILALDGEAVTVGKAAFGSNLYWKQCISLPAVLTGGYEGSEERRQQRLMIPAAQNTLQQAECVLICGNGMGSRKNCEFAGECAGKLGAGFGITRPALMNGWGDVTELIGQSGEKIAPRVCLTLGVAGAGAFLAGIRKTRTIIGVNRDPDALIFKCADYGICMDAEIFLKKLWEEAEKHEL